MLESQAYIASSLRLGLKTLYLTGTENCCKFCACASIHFSRGGSFFIYNRCCMNGLAFIPETLLNQWI